MIAAHPSIGRKPRTTPTTSSRATHCRPGGYKTTSSISLLSPLVSICCLIIRQHHNHFTLTELSMQRVALRWQAAFHVIITRAPVNSDSTMHHGQRRGRKPDHWYVTSLNRGIAIPQKEYVASMKCRCHALRGDHNDRSRAVRQE